MKHLSTVVAVPLSLGLAVLVGCSSDTNESSRSELPTNSSTDGVPQPSGAVETAPPTSGTATTPASSALMMVTEPIVAGQEFKVSYAGRLQEFRGGYLWVKDTDGTSVALLRGDGNPEIPVGYDLNVTVATMLDDGITGETSRFVFPSELSPGVYTLCTANSGAEVCLAIRVSEA